MSIVFNRSFALAVLLLVASVVSRPRASLAEGTTLQAREGFLEVEGGPVWFRIMGGGTETPLLFVHGGPGSRSCVFDPLAEQLSKNRPVILYDQLGSGRSGRPRDTNLWTVKHFITELGQVRTALGVRKVHLLGHSWGAGLVVSYLGAAGASGIESTTLIGPFLSTKIWLHDADLLVAQLPEKVQEILRRHENAGTTQSQEYLAACDVFYSRFYYHKPKPPLPPSCDESRRSDEIYRQMWGPSEFHATGSLLDFDVTSLLPGLKMPVLVAVGRFDEARPETASQFVALMPKARLEIVEECGHMLPLEAPERLAELINDFLAGSTRRKEGL